MTTYRLTPEDMPALLCILTRYVEGGRITVEDLDALCEAGWAEIDWAARAYRLTKAGSAAYAEPRKGVA